MLSAFINANLFVFVCFCFFLFKLMFIFFSVTKFHEDTIAENGGYHSVTTAVDPFGHSFQTSKLTSVSVPQILPPSLMDSDLACVNGKSGRQS